jgi:hypothetical protein
LTLGLFLAAFLLFQCVDNQSRPQRSLLFVKRADSQESEVTERAHTSSLSFSYAITGVPCASQHAKVLHDSAQHVGAAAHRQPELGAAWKRAEL